MKTLLKMLFKEMMYKQSNVKRIDTIDDLCKVIIMQGKLVELFAVLNDEADFGTEEVLFIANKAYQEVHEND